LPPYKSNDTWGYQTQSRKIQNNITQPPKIVVVQNRLGCFSFGSGNIRILDQKRKGDV
jgi:hypothetical protein